MLDPQLTMASIDQVFDGSYSEDDILRARDRTMRERPTDVKGHFRSQFRSLVAARSTPSSAPRALKPAPFGDPYGT
jgi:hypothetical protein